MMYYLLLLAMLALVGPVACNSPDEWISELRICEPTPQLYCNFSHEWKLSTRLLPNETYNYSAGNASVSIFNVKWTIATDLLWIRNFTDPQIIREDIFTPSDESVCLKSVGADRTIVCQNPAHIPTIRESGQYCYNPSSPPSYNVYQTRGTLVQLTFNLTWTLHIEEGSFEFPFCCTTEQYDCDYIGDQTIPMLVNYRSMFQNWLLVDGVPNFAPWVLVDPSSSRLYPYTPFPTEAFLVQFSNINYALAPINPTCIILEGPNAVLNQTANPFPLDIRQSLSEEYGADMDTAKLYLTPISPLRMWLDMKDPRGSFAWLELSLLMPFFNGSHFLHYPSF